MMKILHDAGVELKRIDVDDYYDTVLGEGCSVHMRKVYILLLNEKSTEDSKDTAESSNDWRGRLKEIMDIVDTLEPMNGEWIFGSVKSAMNKALLKMQKYDLNDSTIWEDVYTHLKYVEGIYYVASEFPGSTGVLFQALYDGLRSQLKEGTWRGIKTLQKKDQKIDSIMKALGDRLNGIDEGVFVAIVGGADGMRRIIEILRGK